jgi:hypothetical protein
MPAGLGLVLNAVFGLLALFAVIWPFGARLGICPWWASSRRSGTPAGAGHVS